MAGTIAISVSISSILLTEEDINGASLQPPNWKDAIFWGEKQKKYFEGKLRATRMQIDVITHNCYSVEIQCIVLH